MKHTPVTRPFTIEEQEVGIPFIFRKTEKYSSINVTQGQEGTPCPIKKETGDPTVNGIKRCV